MAIKFEFVKANIGELLSVSPPQKIHAFKEVGQENYVYGWEGDVAGNFHIFDKASYALGKTLHGFLGFSASFTDTTYTLGKLTDVSTRYLADSPDFQWDAIVAANITGVPTNINLKTGLPITSTPTITSTRKFAFVKASVGEILSLDGKTLSTPQKIHVFKEVDTNNYVYGFETSTAGNFYIFDKNSYGLSTKQTLRGFLTFKASLTDSTYNEAKLVTLPSTYSFTSDTIVAANITGVPTDINLKTGLPITPEKDPKLGNNGIADWAWYIWVGIGVAVVGGYLLLKKGFGGKKKILSK